MWGWELSYFNSCDVFLFYYTLMPCLYYLLARLPFRCRCKLTSVAFRLAHILQSSKLAARCFPMASMSVSSALHTPQRVPFRIRRVEVQQYSKTPIFCRFRDRQLFSSSRYLHSDSVEYSRTHPQTGSCGFLAWFLSSFGFL